MSGPPRRLGILATHPIQYFAPLYRYLARQPGVDLTVYFAHRPTASEQGAGFGVAFQWDVDLTSGYPHKFLENVAARPDPEAFRGCDTPAIAGIIHRERFDGFLVSGWNTKSYWQAMTACWRSGTPIFVRGDSQINLAQPVGRRVVRRMVYPLFMRRFDACLSVGIRSAEYFRAHGARRIIASPHFVDNAFFADAARGQERDTCRARWNIPLNSLVIVFAGKFTEKKRPLDLVRAAAAWRLSNLHLLFVGDGPLRRSCEAAVADAGVAATFAGFLNQSEIPAAYAASDALALPSDGRETWGLVVNEAMASGLAAIVSTSAGCAPDLIQDGITGIAHAEGDITAIALAFQQLADTETLSRLRAQAATHVSRYSVEAAGQGVMTALQLSARRRSAA